jgi:hypothetical protein
MNLRLLGISVLGVFLILGMFLSLWSVSKLERKSKETSRSLSALISALIVSSLTYEEVYLKLGKVIEGIDFPVAVIDKNGKLIAYKNVLPEDVGNLRFSEDITYYNERVGVLKYDYPNYVKLLRVITFLLYGGMVVLSALIFYSLYFSIKYERAEFWMGFAKGLAHQLATPVSSLYGWYEVVKENLPENAKEGIKRDLDRLSSVLRRFSKLGGNISLEKVDLFEVVERVLRYMSEKYKSSTNIMLEGERFYIMGDAELLEWAIENLIKNSVEAGADKIKVRLYSKGNRTCLSIIDNGKGFTKKEIGMAFKTSFSTKQKGWGVGLLLVKRIADLHKGSAFIEKSDPFFETIITLCFPTL